MDNEADGYRIGAIVQDVRDQYQPYVKVVNKLRELLISGTVASYKIGNTSYVEIQFYEAKDAKSFYDLLEAL